MASRLRGRLEIRVLRPVYPRMPLWNSKPMVQGSGIQRFATTKKATPSHSWLELLCRVAVVQRVQ